MVKLTLLVFSLVLVNFTTKAVASDLSMLIDPNMCVMEKGQAKCERQVSITWPASDYSQLCLFVEGVKHTCVARGKQGRVMLNIAIERSLRIELKHKQQIIDTGAIKVLKENTVTLEDRFIPWRLI